MKPSRDMVTPFNVSSGATVRVVIWATDGSDLGVFSPDLGFSFVPSNEVTGAVTVSGGYSDPNRVRPTTVSTTIPKVTIY